MAAKRPKTIDDYIAAAPAAGRAHLRRLRKIVAEAAPKAQQVIKWNQPFFVEPRFVFSFSAHKAHASVALMAPEMAAFTKDLARFETTKYTLKLPYDEPIPETLIRRIARHRLRVLREREDASFW